MTDHYKSHPSGIEAIEITQYESFLRGNVIKYIMRAPYKGDELADLEKAAEYLQWEIERVKEDQFWAKFDDTVVKQRLEEVEDMRDEWDEDYKEYYRAGVALNNLFKPGHANYKIKPFDEVVFPDKCQECDGSCKVC